MYPKPCRRGLSHPFSRTAYGENPRPLSAVLELPASRDSLCISHHAYLIRRGGLAIGDQGVNVLHAQPRVGSIETNWGAVRSGRVIDEFLGVFPARRRGWAGDELEDQVEGTANIFGEIRDVLIERPVIHGKEPDLVVFKGNCAKCGVPTFSRSFCVPRVLARSSSFISMNARRDLAFRMTRKGLSTPAAVTSAAAAMAMALISLTVTSGYAEKILTGSRS